MKTTKKRVARIPISKEAVLPDDVRDDPFLPYKSMFRIDEVASYFDVTAQTIRLWIIHGRLEAEKPGGGIRISREAILRCRFKRPEL